MRKMTTVNLAAAFLAASVATAQANELKNCADRTTVTTRLTDKFGEEFAGGGLRNAESIFEVWMSEDSGTWTIIMTRPDGKSCVMAAGTNWREALPQEPKGIPG